MESNLEIEDWIKGIDETMYYEIIVDDYDRYDNVFELLPKLKSNNYTTTNMVVFNEHNRLEKFDNVYSIIKIYCGVRIDYYAKKKEYLLNVLTRELTILNNRYRFITEIINNTLVVFRVPTDKIIEKLIEGKYDKIDDNYDYLLNMTIRSFTKEKLLELKKLLDNKTIMFDKLKKKNINDLWFEDLQELYDVITKDNYIINNK